MGSMAISRFLANKYGLCGANNLVNAQIDEVVDVISDLMQAAYMVFFEKDPTAKEEKMKNFVGKTLPEGLVRLEKCLTIRGGQFFAGNALTWAEFHFLQFIDSAVM